MESNQRIFELNTQLLDLERLKLELREKRKANKKKKKLHARKAHHPPLSAASDGAGGISTSLHKIQSFLLKYRVSAPQTAQTYVQHLLVPPKGRETVESREMQGFIAQCNNTGGGGEAPSPSGN